MKQYTTPGLHLRTSGTCKPIAAAGRYPSYRMIGPQQVEEQFDDSGWFLGLIGLRQSFH